MSDGLNMIFLLGSMNKINNMQGVKRDSAFVLCFTDSTSTPLVFVVNLIYCQMHLSSCRNKDRKELWLY